MKIASEIEQVRCPKCTYDVPFTPTKVLRKGTNELRDLFTGQINRPQCPKCETDFVVETQLLYRDDDCRFVIYFMPIESDEQLSDAIDNMEEVYNAIFQGFQEHEEPNCRLTTKRSEFIEKIALHHHDYDDRLIEYVKYQLFQHSNGLDPRRMDLLFDFSNSTGETMKFIVFERVSGKVLFMLDFAVDDYNKLKSYFLGDRAMERKLSSLFRSYYIHVNSLL